jgi:hypothetical protein
MGGVQPLHAGQGTALWAGFHLGRRLLPASQGSFLPRVAQTQVPALWLLAWGEVSLAAIMMSEHILITIFVYPKSSEISEAHRQCTDYWVSNLPSINPLREFQIPKMALWTWYKYQGAQSHSWLLTSASYYAIKAWYGSNCPLFYLANL